MLPIEKGSPPQELVDAKMRISGTPDATLSWRNTTSSERAATLRELLADQGRLCAYCTRRIDDSNAHVEHIIPQSEALGGDDPSSLSYENLLAVCDGLSGDKNGQICDRARGDDPLTVNPLKSETLETIRYRRDGKIVADDPAVRKDLDKTLNLNHPLLVRNRAAVLRALFAKLARADARGGNRRVVSLCRGYVNEHLSDAATREPFDGAVIYFMNKRLRSTQ